jgi:hypothetical protein
MEGQPGEDVLEQRARYARHERLLREHTWLTKEQQQQICARCTLKKPMMITLSFRGERFGLCDRCLESLWQIATSDD